MSSNTTIKWSVVFSQRYKLRYEEVLTSNSMRILHGDEINSLIASVGKKGRLISKLTLIGMKFTAYQAVFPEVVDNVVSHFNIVFSNGHRLSYIVFLEGREYKLRARSLTDVIDIHCEHDHATLSFTIEKENGESIIFRGGLFIEIKLEIILQTTTDILEQSILEQSILEQSILEQSILRQSMTKISRWCYFHPLLALQLIIPMIVIYWYY